MSNCLKKLLFAGVLCLGLPVMALAENTPPSGRETVSATSVSVQQGQPAVIDVTGVVKDENGEPLIGVSIVPVGDKNAATMTDIDGKFKIKVDPKEELQISYVGYSTIKVGVNGRKSLDITMKDKVENLDEAVVVGYGSMRKRDLTGAIISVTGETLENRHVHSVSQALQGVMPGVTVSRSSGSPEEAASIRVRGVTTINESSPLVLIDGVEGTLEDVNPTDVDNISVLKDAASASIYGARAAAGVILVTTKTAKDNKLRLTYNFEQGMQYFSKHPQTLNAVQRLERDNLELYMSNPAGGMYQRYSQEYIDAYPANHASDPDAYPDTDWHSAVYKSWAPSQKHSLAIIGGSKYVKSNVSVGYDKVDGMYDNRTFDRLTARANNIFTINKFISGRLDINFSRKVTEKPTRESDIHNKVWSMWANRAAYWSDGRIGDGGSDKGENPLACVYDGGLTHYWNSSLGAHASITVTPVKGLSVTGVYAPRFSWDEQKIFTQAMPYTALEDPNTIKGYRYGVNETKLEERRNRSNTTTWQFYANFSRGFGRHYVNLTAGYESYYAYYENLTAGRGQYSLTEYPYLDVGSAGLQTNSGNAREMAHRSYYARAAYNYRNRYLLQANVRYDGSSRFHPDHRWGFFPSFSAGWVLTEEPLINKLNISRVLSYLKLRASWGVLGNERINSNYYPYQAVINIQNTPFFSANGGLMSQMSASQWAYAVENLTWEKTATFDIGLDAYFVNGKLNLTADYYDKKTTDMLMDAEIPRYVGFDNPQRNVGSMSTTGFELSVAWRDIIGDFSYGVSLNLSDAVSKIDYMTTPKYIWSTKVNRTGSEFQEWYGYRTDGLFLTQDDFDTSVKYDVNQTIGDIKFLDISGPDGIPDGKISEYDKTTLGSSMPHYEYGGSISLGWKGIDLNMSFMGVAKQLAYCSYWMYNGPDNLDNFWQNYKTWEENAAAKLPRQGNFSTQNNQFSEFWLFNGSWFRVKNVTLGYTLPTRWVNRAMLKNVRVYASLNDPLCISRYPNNWDPEVGNNTGNYPIMATLIFGLNVTF